LATGNKNLNIWMELFVFLIALRGSVKHILVAGGASLMNLIPEPMSVFRNANI
jgi:hypothetical protein